MSLPLEILKPRLLLGEGREEEYFFKAILKYLGISDIQVENFSGKDNLSRYMKALPSRSGFSILRSIGITRDADDNLESAFDSAKSAVKSINISPPGRIGEFVNENPKIGIFIFPNGKSRGMLEDLCLSYLDDRPEMRCIDEMFRCVQEETLSRPNNMSKARIRVWLATLLEPDRRLGEAAQNGSFAWDDPCFSPLVQFIQEIAR